MSRVPVSSRDSWLLGLVADDAGRRRVALERQAKLLATAAGCLQWRDSLWYQNGNSNDFSHSPKLAAEADQALAMQENAWDRTLIGLAANFTWASWSAELEEAELAPYAVLFLQWEARFPDEWRGSSSSSPWGLKLSILRRFIRVGPLGWDRELTELVMAAVSRVQRCEDGWYASLARHLDSPELRSMLGEATESADPVVRLRARYVRAMLDERSTPVTPASWRRWLAAASS